MGWYYCLLATSYSPLLLDDTKCSWMLRHCASCSSVGAAIIHASVMSSSIMRAAVMSIMLLLMLPAGLGLMQQQHAQRLRLLLQCEHLCAENGVLLLEVACLVRRVLLALFALVAGFLGGHVVALAALVVLVVFELVGDGFLAAAGPALGGRGRTDRCRRC
jgi:hypothetical protein